VAGREPPRVTQIERDVQRVLITERVARIEIEPCEHDVVAFGVGGIVDPTRALTAVLRSDTTNTERHDVVLARFDFDPSDALGDEYSLKRRARSG